MQLDQALRDRVTIKIIFAVCFQWDQSPTDMFRVLNDCDPAQVCPQYVIPVINTSMLNISILKETIQFSVMLQVDVLHRNTLLVLSKLLIHISVCPV